MEEGLEPAMNFESLRLPRDFFVGPTEQVALSLLGKLLVTALPDGQRLSGFIVEVEAYLADQDPASHSARGPTPKNASMFAPPGTLYVYSIHAKHCLNIVTETAGRGAAVLIRALEPWEGRSTMLEHRRLHSPDSATSAQEAKQATLETTLHNPQLELKTAIRLTSGPGRLCQALAIDRRHDGLDLPSSQVVWLETQPEAPSAYNTRSSPRIGISQACELPLRWFIDGHYFVSGRAGDHSRGRWWSFRNG
jgi:DNA-3-methyladenine glycosylase